MTAAYTATDFRKDAAVDADGMKKLEIYARLLAEWNGKINLVADSTLPHIWQRHFMDSAQLFPLIPREAESLADIGSGAGFPGLVLAIMGVPGVTLIEKDLRKAAFLRTVAAETGTRIDLLNLRAEEVEDRQFDIITARALADFSELLALSRKLRKPSTICLFLKGKNLDLEIAKAQKEWVMDMRHMRSVTDPDATVLRVAKIARHGSL